MNDTITAIATAYGVGSIAIIRLSGERALSIAEILTKRDGFKVRYAHLAPLYDAKEELIDEAIIVYFQGPNSFSGEDVVEFQCHGGTVVAQAILQATLDAGARLAEPGEFSKRAFMNGRIDLTEAEAIAQLIEAKSEDAAKILAKQMKGALRHYVEEVRDQLLHALAYSEVTIDYAEEDLPPDLIDQIQERLREVSQKLRRTLQASESRQGLMQGFKVSLIGKPNVGKSSLLNLLLNYNRAIVSDIAGTTRDTIEEQVKIGSHMIRIVDTAGIRVAGDEIERIGIERTIEAVEESDIVIAIFDGSRQLDDEDRKIIELMNAHKTDREFICVINKQDLEQKFDRGEIEPFSPMGISAKEDAAALIEMMKTIMDRQNVSDEMMLISSRQIESVKKALFEIDEAVMPLSDQDLEIFSFHMNRAIHAMASITRPFDNDEMLDKMFGSFCLGK